MFDLILLFLMEHRAATTLLQRTRFSMPSSARPITFQRPWLLRPYSSARSVLVGPLYTFPRGFHSRDCLVMFSVGFCSMWPIHSHFVFSSSELKAQVSFSDRLLSVVCPFVWCLSVRLLHFQLLLQNRWANFNQSWHKSSLGKEDLELYKWRTTPFP
jgi:hypothetical protein